MKCENAEKCKGKCYHKEEHLHGLDCDIECVVPGGVMLSKCKKVKKTEGWQPIETAPKGRAILVVDELDIYIVFWHPMNHNWQIKNAASDYVKDPTHWMELPEGPK